MKRCLPLLLGLVGLFVAPIASACMECEAVSPCTVNPFLDWCYECINPPEGVWGSMYCVMFEDGGCALGNINCQGSGPWGGGRPSAATATFNQTWRVATVRMLPPGAPLRDDVQIMPVTVASNRSP
jgi:hypothetical protein